MPICTKCHVEKSQNNFYIRNKNKNTYRKDCKDCHKLKGKEWVQKNPEKRKQILWKYAEIHNRKKCVICKSKFTPVPRERCCSIKCKLFDGIKKDKKSGCWIWKRVNNGNYGKLRGFGKTLSAHRASYITFKGEIPKGLNVCHSCDNPLCINPDHLWLGTSKENRQDAMRKGRTPIGEKNVFARLTNIQIEEMRLLRFQGFTLQRLSRIFNCTITHVWNVVHNKLRKS